MEKELEKPGEEKIHIKTGKHIEEGKPAEASEVERYVGGRLSDRVAYAGIILGFLVILTIALSKKLGMVF